MRGSGRRGTCSAESVWLVTVGDLRKAAADGAFDGDRLAARRGDGPEGGLTVLGTAILGAVDRAVADVTDDLAVLGRALLGGE